MLTQVELEVDPGIEALVPPQYVDHVLAIASEAMFNAVRHARPNRVRVQLKRTRRRLSLAVWDDGAGFDTSRPNRSDAQGLANMAARARQLGGQFRVASHPRAGTEVRVDVPLIALEPRGQS